MKKISWNPLKNKSLGTFLHYSMQYKWQMLAVVLLSALASAMSAIPAWLSKYLIDDVLVKQEKNMLFLVLGGMFFCTLIKVVAVYYADIGSGYITEVIKRDIKVDIFKHLQKLPLHYYKTNKLGDIMARLSGDTSTLGRIGFIIFEMFKEFLTTFVLIIRMFQVDYILALVSLIVLPLILQIVRKYTKKIRKSGRVRQDMAGAITAFTQESLSGIFVVKAFNAMKIMISKYEKISYEEFQKSFRTAKIKAKVSPQ